MEKISGNVPKYNDQNDTTLSHLLTEVSIVYVFPGSLKFKIDRNGIL